MKPMSLPRIFRSAAIPAASAAFPLFLSGCDWVVLNPSGDVAVQQSHLIGISTLLMLLIIAPVLVLTLWFAWRYRKAHPRSAEDYAPDWDHSLSLELVIWAAPLLIIIVLGAVTWISTHLLDPYRPLSRIDEGRPVAPTTRPLVVEAVALDWKWLFIYPEQGVASLNEMAAPVDTPIEFHITSESVLNSFYIPALAGQIYAMPGMQAPLHAVINKAGDYEGLSANYSGAGFSGMHFTFHATDWQGFDHWVQQARDTGGTLDRAGYQALATPGPRGPVQRFGAVEGGLFDAVVNRCVRPGTPCIRDMASRPNLPGEPGERPGAAMNHGE
jgi:cytochrome o ubiquinol oxidase subunit 2